MSFLDHIPAVQPPPGEVSDLINPPSQAHIVSVLDGVSVTFMLIAVLIRIFVRLKYIKTWAWDDTTCILAALGSLSHTILYTEMVKIGYGRHIWDFPASWLILPQNIQLLQANGITYPVTICLAKISILLFYLRIFGLISKPFNVIVHTGGALLVAFYSAMVLVCIVSLNKCVGLESSRTPFCLAYSGPIVIANATFNVVTDFWILLLPLPLLSILRLRPGQKWGIAAVFGAGIGACAASLARLVQFSLNYRTSDVFWVQATNAQFTIVEMNIAIIVACMACFPCFYTKARECIQGGFTKLRSRHGTSISKGSSGVTDYGQWGGSPPSSKAVSQKHSRANLKAQPEPYVGESPKTLSQIELPEIPAHLYQK
ncbi:hypothetical protein QBC37DRAFT_374930 [Rhypophila decipiens]|uniref:Rhodopsin domain-containing protein n=1 Tax=Rhypophila decipiens TaxID=261697 RepID=A0AAN6Y4I7_9PEZI|nr:hypothetical protein QBC37DRAFT_374930 [Rhypophila decipiens]